VSLQNLQFVGGTRVPSEFEFVDGTGVSSEFSVCRGNTQRGDAIGFGLCQFELCQPFINSA